MIDLPILITLHLKCLKIKEKTNNKKKKTSDSIAVEIKPKDDVLDITTSNRECVWADITDTQPINIFLNLFDSED